MENINPDQNSVVSSGTKRKGENTDPAGSSIVSKSARSTESTADTNVVTPLLYFFEVVKARESREYLSYWKHYKKKEKIASDVPPKTIEILGTETVQDLFKKIFTDFIRPVRISGGSVNDETWSTHIWSIEHPESLDDDLWDSVDSEAEQLPKIWYGSTGHNNVRDLIFEGEQENGGDPSKVQVKDMGLSIKGVNQLKIEYDLCTSTNLMIRLTSIAESN